MFQKLEDVNDNNGRRPRLTMVQRFVVGQCGLHLPREKPKEAGWAGLSFRPLDGCMTATDARMFPYA
jgi:hypothetical protein